MAKFRQGFVSNSSSSSFICQYCGEIEAGMDMGMEDARMYECTDGHMFCESHVGKVDSATYILAGKKQIAKDIEHDKKYIDEYQIRVNDGFGDEKLSTYSSATYQSELDRHKKCLIESEENLEKINAYDVDSEDFDEDELSEFVEETIFGGDWRYSFPTELCPVCAVIKAKQEQRETNASDPDWKTYVTLYAKFKGITPS